MRKFVSRENSRIWQQLDGEPEEIEAQIEGMRETGRVIVTNSPGCRETVLEQNKVDDYAKRAEIARIHHEQVLELMEKFRVAQVLGAGRAYPDERTEKFVKSCEDAGINPRVLG